MLQKNYFDYQKEINSKFFKDFNFISFNIEKKILLEINKCVVDLFNYSEDKNFKNISPIISLSNVTGKNVNILKNIYHPVELNFQKRKY